MSLANAPDRTMPPHPSARPWWKEFYVWLVIAGPLAAVIACVVTAFYILKGPDALVSEDYYREGIALSRDVKTAPPPMQPAQTGRNHSATGGQKNAAP
jgi:uncharacterized protein